MYIKSIVWIILWFYYTANYSVLVTGESTPGTFKGNSKECGNTVLKAEARTNYASTPGYPKAFPGDISCTWAIYCSPGKRIRLEFKRFFLLGDVDGTCHYQSVVIRSPFTLFYMGPYCGEVGLPTIVSTGNLIYIELTTPVPVTTDNYSGFQVAFQETEESSSYELRPDNSADDIIMTVDPATMNMLSPTPPTTTVITERATKSTTKPSRWRPGLNLNWNGRPAPTVRNNPTRSSRVPPRTRYPSRPSSNIRPPSSRPNNYQQSGYNNGIRTKVVRPSNDDENEVKIEIIVGIAVGGAVVVAIIIAIAVKAHLNQKRKREKKAEAAAAKNLKDETAAIEKSGTLPAYYATPGADQFYYQEQYQGQPYVYYYDAENYPMQQMETSQPPRSSGKSSTLPTNYGTRKDQSMDTRRKKRAGTAQRVSSKRPPEAQSTSRRGDQRYKVAERNEANARAYNKR